jgi:ubiquinone/menaquinone biosynthesis C-methylase UbiE
MKPEVDMHEIEQQTHVALAAGHRIFQPWRLAADDDEHVRLMLADMEPLPRGATVLDVGCGVGEVAARMAVMRPDLEFIIVNASKVQLMLCPHGERFTGVLADAHDLPLGDASVNAVMFAASLCQMDRDVALREARRVADLGSVLLVNDMVRTSPIPRQWEEHLGVSIPTHAQLLAAMQNAGWVVDWFEYPSGSDAHFRQMLEVDEIGGFADCVRHVVVRGLC